MLPAIPALVATVGLTLVIGLHEPLMIGAEIAGVFGLVVLALRRPAGPRRIAVLGSAGAAEALAADLGRRGAQPVMVGRIAPTAPTVLDRYWLGSIADVRAVVERHEIDLLVLARGVPRMQVFEALDRSWPDMPVRMCELSLFYEGHFGQVPIAEINSAWLQCLMDPGYTSRVTASKRVFDLLFSVVVGALVTPLLLLLALLIRRDGGPALYRQNRVGEGGRPFTMLKLRTMSVRSSAETAWTRPDDDRVTGLGVWLRRTHVDELPQLLNVLRGEMSVVGPRPEQPHYVEDLERTMPFYSRRHHLRPGLTGWAQVRCGYGGSQLGTALKLSHDLYYLKHRRLSLDLQIVLLTLKTPFAKDQFAEPEQRPLVLGEIVVEVMPEVAMALGSDLSPVAVPSN